jgi:large subunit ribosomal protein L24
MKKTINCHIKIGDKVKVITGSNKGTIGTINSILFKKSIVFIEEILPRIKYIKNTQGEESKKIEVKKPIHISNVMLWDSESNNASKIGYKVIDSKKYRYFKKSGKIIS